ncbi:GNAT family N-acetyltransferase [Sphingobacterium hungaricum]|uniref:GNAT family N-acetyltransferase n=1 Tax=Sphingobacterium hungaricum TaxID=2082723 RepID=A0A928V345_9SPHI|nr:GNAT family N-acetyltransferase [Sphingobacterium hungaricum]MBE8715234.1 GNAT family N-acetyltransferase [Sphingobacterium hungaricum]
MSLTFKIAEIEQVSEIVRLLAEDKLGKQRENYTEPLPDVYINAFRAISQDPNQELIVVFNAENELVGTLQLSFLQYLTYQGGLRAQIEAVRIREQDRGKGSGTLFFEWAIDRAKERGAHLIQLTTDKQRPEALAFYKKLGFTNSHEGMKMQLKA